MQPKWKKKQKQAEREAQKKAKSEKLAKLRDPNEKSGFRKIHIGTDVWQWRYLGGRVDIRIPGVTDRKYLVPIWAFQGYENEIAWLKDHSECYEECSANWIEPRMVRDYIKSNIIPTEAELRR